MRERSACLSSILVTECGLRSPRSEIGFAPGASQSASIFACGVGAAAITRQKLFETSLLLTYHNVVSLHLRLLLDQLLAVEFEAEREREREH